MRREVWQMIGEPPDLDPSTDTQYSGAPLLHWVINQAQNVIASWRDPEEGWRLRIRTLFNTMFFKLIYKTSTLAVDATDASNVILPVGMVSDGDDRYNGWILEHNSERRVIVDFATATRTATVHSAFGTTPASGDTVSLYKNFSLLLPSTHAWVNEHIPLPAQTDTYRATGNLEEIIKISDLDDERVLSKARSGDNYIRTRFDIGEPREWYRFGNRLVFDRGVDSTRWYEMEYYRLPTELTAITDECELPEMFHYAVILWAVEWGLRRDHESSEKYSTKRDLVDFMRRAKSQYDFEFYREPNYGLLRRQ
jgi:hypothetical protein